MALRIVAGALLGAVVLFAWGAVFWMALPFGFIAVKPLPGGEDLVPLLTERLPATGVYAYPAKSHEERNLPEEERERHAQDFAARYKAGPLLVLHYRRQGLDPMQPLLFAAGFLHFLALTLLAAGLLAAAAHRLAFGGRFLFTAAIGLVIALMDLSPLIWWHLPPDLPLLSAAYNLSGWLLAAPVLAWLVRPKKG